MGKMRIGIDCEDGERLVDCDFVKDGLAVHQYPRGIVNNWTVTHTPSGLAVARGGASQEDARRVVQELLPLADWSQDRCDLLPSLAPIRGDALRIIERHGLVRVTEIRDVTK